MPGRTPWRNDWSMPRSRSRADSSEKVSLPRSARRSSSSTAADWEYPTGAEEVVEEEGKAVEEEAAEGKEDAMNWCE